MSQTPCYYLVFLGTENDVCTLPFSLAQPEPEPHPEFANQYVCLAAFGRGEAPEALLQPLVSALKGAPTPLFWQTGPGHHPGMGSIPNQKAKKEKHFKESNSLPLPSPAPSALPPSPTSPNTLFLAPLLRHSSPLSRPKDKPRTFFLRPTGPSA